MDETILRLMAHAAALMMCQFSKTCLNKRISPEEVFDGIKFLTVSNISLNVVVERMFSHKRIRSVIKNRFPNHVSFTQVSSKSGVKNELKSLYHVNFDRVCETVVFDRQSIIEELILESLFVFHDIAASPSSLDPVEILMAPRYV